MKQIDYFQKYGIILLVVSPTAKWTAKSVSNSNGVTTQMAMWKRIAIFYEEIYANGFLKNLLNPSTSAYCPQGKDGHFGCKGTNPLLFDFPARKAI